MKPPKSPKRSPSSLGILAAVLLLSGLVRMSEQPLFASAENAEVQKEVSTSQDLAILGVPFSGDAIETILTAFQAREARLLNRENELQELEDVLTQAELRITNKIVELTTIEEMLASTLALADTAAEDDLRRLATVYENMKPKDTAALFSEMAPGFAAGFLGLMQAEAAAAVMTELEPQIAHTISVMLAGRNANAFNPE
jgi:flagellar motility protein MotE (MotC chaperone)